MLPRNRLRRLKAFEHWISAIERVLFTNDVFDNVVIRWIYSNTTFPLRRGGH